MNFLISQLIAIVQHVRQVTIYVHHIDNDNDRTKSFKTTDNETYVSILIQSCITVTRCTHTLLYHLYIILEREEQKKKEQIEIIFFLSIQKRGDLSTSCIQDYLSVTSYALCTHHFADDCFLRYSFFFFIRKRYLDITKHQVTLTFVPYIYF